MPELYGGITFLAGIAVIYWVIRFGRWTGQTRRQGDQLAADALRKRQNADIDQRGGELGEGLHGTGGNWEERR